MSSKTVIPQLFIHGRPVQPDEFLNREDELHTVRNRMCNGGSVAGVREPHVGTDVGGQHRGGV